MTKHMSSPLERIGLERLRSTLRESDLKVRLLSPGTNTESGPADGQPFSLALELRGLGENRILRVAIVRSVPYEKLTALQRHARLLRTRSPDSIPLLLVPHLTPRARAALRKARINHADFGGTISVREPGIRIEVTGSTHKYAWEQPSGTVNIFSDRSSLVLRVLLGNAKQPCRASAIAQRAAVTKGWVSIVGRALIEAGYVERNAHGLRVVDAPRLLRDWTDAYNWRRNPAKSYHSPLERDAVIARLPGLMEKRSTKWALTLLAGSSLIAPHVEHDQVHFYVEADRMEDLDQAIRRDLYLEPASEGGNVHILRPYYKFSAFFEFERIKEVHVVSALQLFLDLFDYPVRGREAAELVLRTRLSESFGLSARETASLL